MTLKQHVIAGALAGIVFYPLLGPGRALLFFFSSFLIDVDHYLDFFWKAWKAGGRDFSPKRMFSYYDHSTAHRFDKNNIGFSLLHTVEVYLIIYLLAVFVNYSFFITILGGMSFHMIFDVLSMASEKLHFKRAFSIFEYHGRKYHMKKKGLDPDGHTKRIYELSEKPPEKRFH